MAQTKADRLAALREKERQLKAQIAQIEAREKATERKLDTRRKILIGGAVLAKVKRGAWPEKQLRELVDSELTKDRDRLLFDLSPKADRSDQDTKASDAK
ncbi:MAG: mobilization protein C [Gammaproteobacteria bacterium HGW-Gammaproteobacteria-8]|jgi:hypothetical protein|nr:MAG: mobilization protein C [Gammaproteobacteria bacterium HGW-Gammaproteobacteria-8]